MSGVTSLKTKPTTRDLLAGIKVVDADSHVSEWPTLWTERAPASLKDKVPRIVGEGEEKRWVIGDDNFIHHRCSSAALLADGRKVRG